MKLKSIVLVSAALLAGSLPVFAKKSSAKKFAVNAEESAVLYLTFDSENEAGFTYKGSPVKGEGLNGQALVFDGQDDYLELDKKILEGEGLTFSVNIKAESWSYWERIFDFGNGSDCDVWLGYDQATKALRLAAGRASALAPLPPVNEWTNVTVTFGEKNAVIYVNGKLSQKLSIGVSPQKVLASVKGIYVGKSNWNDPMFKGSMDDIFIATRVFSAEEVASLAAGIVDTSSIGYQK
ncbi:LamG domain-containing protein [Treponema sp.]|uniref:LamG domain-containing protein n=1 Tax=Treponema sp. TaxID=166 RepID=UPI0025EDA9B6|nr:LamG domain-containing protein [Treponema sp.]MCR5217365.1 LamG domain-containing protein [Treponema sp.]